MENETRYDLNAAIGNWRQELAAQTSLTAEVRRELETHLRDTIAGFRQRGLNDEESFWLARRRVGPPQQLSEEFLKVNPTKIWRERIFWMWLALFLSSTLGSLGHSFALAVTATSFHANNNTHLQILGITIVSCSVLIPLVLAIGLAKGKMVVQFSKLVQLAGSRWRLAMGVSACLLLSSAAQIVALEILVSKSHQSWGIAWISSITSASYSLVVGLILIWLMPPQKSTIRERA
jgi:hypothetical protein